MNQRLTLNGECEDFTPSPALAARIQHLRAMSEAELARRTRVVEGETALTLIADRLETLAPDDINVEVVSEVDPDDAAFDAVFSGAADPEPKAAKQSVGTEPPLPIPAKDATQEEKDAYKKAMDERARRAYANSEGDDYLNAVAQARLGNPAFKEWKLGQPFAPPPSEKELEQARTIDLTQEERMEIILNGMNLPSEESEIDDAFDNLTVFVSDDLEWDVLALRAKARIRAEEAAFEPDITIVDEDELDYVMEEAAE